MDFDLPPEIVRLRETARKFAEDELVPREESLPANGGMPASVLADLQVRAREYGLWQLDVPQALGGQGLGLLASCVVAEQVDKTSVTAFRRNAVLGPQPGALLYSAEGWQRDDYLYPALKGEKKTCFAQTEPGAGTDPASMSTLAEDINGGFRLNGVKAFIGGVDEADFAQVMCVTDPNANRHERISCLLVDMDSPGIRIEAQAPTMMGDTHWMIEFRNVEVPARNLLGQRGAGFKQGQLWLTHGRVRNQAALCLAVSQRALDMAVAYARKRSTFGKLLSERQAVQMMIAESAMELRIMRSLVYEVAWRYDQGEDVRDLSYMAKLYATEAGHRIVDRALQIHGSLGLTSELPLEYWYRQIRSLWITEGASEVLRWRLGRNVMRTPEQR